MNAAPAPLEDVDEGDVDLPLLQRFSVTAAHGGQRVDKVLALLLPEVSRSRIRQWIEANAVRVNGAAPRPRDEVVEGDVIDLEPPPAPEALAFRAEPMPLAIVHEDDEIIVVDKPPGLVVHPAAGNWSGTLLNGLLAHDRELARVPRAGIVHRLDADTSGLMVVARTLRAQTELVRQLQARSVTREYWAIVFGAAPPAGTIEAPIGRDPRNPLRFKVSRAASARPARTRFRRVQAVEAGTLKLSWIACRLDTGRTHQIRVHLESIGHPLVGDPVYRKGRPTHAQGHDAPAWARFERQALHACSLALDHPASGARMAWFRAPPPDMRALMRALGLRGGEKPVAVFE
ncbi:MAG: pseudouridine synthase [Betaproteobacteria bacterium]|jgi:23S rRNA pseudouridine1911/1915/1917 synthase|nr:MAG: pseudouridine synthase [Betaproteobacteria bacterium]